MGNGGWGEEGGGGHFNHCFDCHVCIIQSRLSDQEQGLTKNLFHTKGFASLDSLIKSTVFCPL